jgi:accessory colonization factor AcfC
MPNLIDTRGCLSATADKSARIVKDKNGISATQQEALWGNKAAGRTHRVEDFSDFRMT